MDDLADAVLRGSLGEVLPALLSGLDPRRRVRAPVTARIGVVVAPLRHRRPHAALPAGAAGRRRVTGAHAWCWSTTARAPAWPTACGPSCPTSRSWCPARTPGSPAAATSASPRSGRRRARRARQQRRVVAAGLARRRSSPPSTPTPRLGAVVPKTRFEGRFHELVIEAAATLAARAAATGASWPGSRRPSRSTASTSPTACQLVDGFWEPGRGGRWAGARAAAPRPGRSPGGRRLRVELATPPRRAADVDADRQRRASCGPSPGERLGRPALDGEPVIPSS